MHNRDNMNQNIPQNLNQSAEMSDLVTYRLVYPEIFYKLQPFVMMACDQMDSAAAMPSQDVIEGMADRIYEDVCRMYPDIEEYAREREKSAQNNPALSEVLSVRRFRRRGLLRDIIEILLLSELFGRRRRRVF